LDEFLDLFILQTIVVGGQKPFNLAFLGLFFADLLAGYDFALELLDTGLNFRLLQLGELSGLLRKDWLLLSIFQELIAIFRV